MKLRLRFIFFFMGGLFAFILFMGIFVAVFFDIFIPHMGIREGRFPLMEIAAVLFPFLAGGVFLGLFFVNPLVYIISLIRDLSSGTRFSSNINEKLYKRNGKLKLRYFLYQELIVDIYKLSDDLASAKKEREKVEEVKTNWIAGVSHDLKTPLSYITGYSSLLLDQTNPWSEEQQKNYLNEIHDKSVVIAEMIGDLNLSFKLDSLGEAYPLNKTRFDLVDFSRRLMADIANNPKAPEYVLGFHCNADHVTVHADEKLLYRALQNLVVNAISHNPKGTSIEITIERYEESGQVSITVSDNGIGMDQAVLEKLFARYYRPEETDNSSGGLGLSMVKSIVDAHNGRIKVKSVKDEGTSVRIQIPYVLQICANDMPCTPIRT